MFKRYLYLIQNTVLVLIVCFCWWFCCWYCLDCYDCNCQMLFNQRPYIFMNSCSFASFFLAPFLLTFRSYSSTGSSTFSLTLLGLTELALPRERVLSRKELPALPLFCELLRSFLLVSLLLVFSVLFVDFLTTVELALFLAELLPSTAYFLALPAPEPFWLVLLYFETGAIVACVVPEAPQPIFTLN